MRITDANPYHELVRFCRINPDRADAVMDTVNHIDMVHLVPRGTAPALFAAALHDEICPPSTVFAAANAIPVPPTVEVYPFNGHEGGGQEQWLRSVRWLGEVLA